MLKKIISIFLITTLIFNLTACINDTESAETSTANYLIALKTKDKETIAKYTGTTAKEDTADEFSRYMLNELLDHMTFKMISSEENEESAFVTVSISNINAHLVIDEVLSKTLSMALSGMEKEEISAIAPELFKSSFEKHTKDVVTHHIKLPLTKGDGYWIIHPTEEMFDAVIGGLQSAITEIH